MIKTRVKTIEYIDDARSLSTAEWSYLITMGWFEYFDQDEDKMHLEDMNTINKIHSGLWHGHTMHCNPNDGSVTVTVKDAGHVDIVPTIDGETLEVYFFNECDDTPIWVSKWGIDNLYDSGIIEL